jgi:hypothetical protein
MPDSRLALIRPIDSQRQTSRLPGVVFEIRHHQPPFASSFSIVLAHLTSPMITPGFTVHANTTNSSVDNFNSNLPFPGSISDWIWALNLLDAFDKPLTRWTHNQSQKTTICECDLDMCVTTPSCRSSLTPFIFQERWASKPVDRL